MKKTLTVKIEVEMDGSGRDDYKVAAVVEDQLEMIIEHVKKGTVSGGARSVPTAIVQYETQYTITEE